MGECGVVRWLETVARTRLVGALLGVVGLFAMSGWLADAELLLAVSGLSGFAGTGAVGWRLWADTLPLKLGQHAATLEINGHRAFQARAMLGRGRMLTSPWCEARWVPEQGEPHALTMVGPGVTALLGPWTVLAVDLHDQIVGPGTVEVRLGGREGRQTHEVDGRWMRERLSVKGLAPALLNDGGQLRWSVAGWDAPAS